MGMYHSRPTYYEILNFLHIIMTMLMIYGTSNFHHMLHLIEYMQFLQLEQNFGRCKILISLYDIYHTDKLVI